jgi:hypothetical protein
MPRPCEFPETRDGGRPDDDRRGCRNFRWVPKRPGPPEGGPEVFAMSLVSKGEFGGCTRTRTLGPLIKSQLLYQLSYAPAVFRAVNQCFAPVLGDEG